MISRSNYLGKKGRRIIIRILICLKASQHIFQKYLLAPLDLTEELPSKNLTWKLVVVSTKFNQVQAETGATIAEVILPAKNMMDYLTLSTIFREKKQLSQTFQAEWVLQRSKMMLFLKILSSIIIKSNWLLLLQWKI